MCNSIRVTPGVENVRFLCVLDLSNVSPTLSEPVISVRSICPLKLIHFTNWNSGTTTQLQLIFYYFSNSKFVLKFSLPFFSSLGFKSYGCQILPSRKKKKEVLYETTLR